MIDPVSKKSQIRRGMVCAAVPLCIVLVRLLFITACTSTQGPGNLATENQTPVPITTVTPESKALYKVTIAQPNDTKHPDYIVMDSDVYNQGEVIEFALMNLGSEPLGCASLEPNYYVGYEMENGSWKLVATEVEQPVVSLLQPGQSSRTSRLDTTNWSLGHYRISFNCGRISRDFLIRTTPAATELGKYSGDAKHEQSR